MLPRCEYAVGGSIAVSVAVGRLYLFQTPGDGPELAQQSVTVTAPDTALVISPRCRGLVLMELERIVVVWSGGEKLTSRRSPEALDTVQRRVVTQVSKL